MPSIPFGSRPAPSAVRSRVQTGTGGASLVSSTLYLPSAPSRPQVCNDGPLTEPTYVVCPNWLPNVLDTPAAAHPRQLRIGCFRADRSPLQNCRQPAAEDVESADSCLFRMKQHLAINIPCFKMPNLRPTLSASSQWVLRASAPQRVHAFLNTPGPASTGHKLSVHLSLICLTMTLFRDQPGKASRNASPPFTV